MGDYQPERDPRSGDEFKTRLVEGGSKKDVLAHIFYSKESEDGKKPTERDLPFLKPEFTDDRVVVIHDARGLDMTVDENGFEYFIHPKPEADFSSEESIRGVYYPAMEKMIKEKFGASEVFFFNHRVRNTPFNTKYGTDYQGYNGPVVRPHVDFAPAYAPSFIKKLRPHTYQEYETRRWQVINFWRPLSTVLRDPLTVSDAGTIPESDELLHVAYENTPHQTETYLTKGGEKDMHKWYYFPEQQPDELLAFKIYDSAPKHENVRMVPHTAFRGVDVEGAPTRYSIEVRCFLAYD